MKQSSIVGGAGKKRTIPTVLLIFIGFLAVMFVAELVVGQFRFFSGANWFNIMMQVSCVGVMAMGMTIVMISGGIDLSVGLLASLIAIFTALTISRAGVPVPLGIALAILLAVALESFMGFIISRLEVEPFIITLGGMILFRGIALLMCGAREVTMKGELDFFKTNLIEGANAGGLSMTLPVYVLVFIAVTLVIWWVLKYTKYGRRVYAVGANPNAAYLAGINVKNMKLSTYALNGLLVGLAAVMLTARVNVAIISLGESLEIDVIAAVVIGGVAMSGGKGNPLETFLGVILLGAITNGMNVLRLPSEWQFVAKGAIIIAAVSAGALSMIMTTRANLKKQKHEAEMLIAKKEEA